MNLSDQDAQALPLTQILNRLDKILFLLMEIQKDQARSAFALGSIAENIHALATYQTIDKPSSHLPYPRST